MAHTARWRAVAELAASQHGAFHRSQAADHLTSRTLRRAELRGDLRRPFPHVYVLAATPDSWRQRLAALSLTGGVVSHRSAAALHEFDGFAAGRLEVTFPRGLTPPMPWRVDTHETDLLGEADRCSVDAINATSIVATLIGLAAVVPPRRVESALDSALRRGLTVEVVRDAIDRAWRPGPTGLGPLRRLLDDPARAGNPPDSMFERRVERLIVDHGLPRPCRQFEIEVQGGVRRVDLAWPAQRVAVEAHSKRWHFGRSAEADDNRRDIELAAAGWRVIYVTWAMSQHPAHFLRQLGSILGRP